MKWNEPQKHNTHKICKIAYTCSDSKWILITARLYPSQTIKMINNEFTEIHNTLTRTLAATCKSKTKTKINTTKYNAPKYPSNPTLNLTNHSHKQSSDSHLMSQESGFWFSKSKLKYKKYNFKNKIIMITLKCKKLFIIVSYDFSY